MHLALFLQNQLSQEQIQKLVFAMMAFIPILVLIGIAIVLIPAWFICKKAGFSPWLSLLCLIPSLGTLVLLYVLAFADWKVAPIAPQSYVPQPPYPPPPNPPLA
jgi:uncharacterized membrane protein YhaH (DUF805 family)